MYIGEQIIFVMPVEMLFPESKPVWADIGIRCKANPILVE
jgi:hypothetical protein